MYLDEFYCTDSSTRLSGSPFPRGPGFRSELTSDHCTRGWAPTPTGSATGDSPCFHSSSDIPSIFSPT